ncbi:MAG: hypothetical protein N2578_01015 [Bdellovibrionaceae bacterium]|nr:hypothetical protein [Pseudobdellovibrionaceae bacterium]
MKKRAFLFLVILIFQSIFGYAADERQLRSYSGNYDLRGDKKAGVSLAYGGAAGAPQLGLELNFVPEHSAVTGVGFGPSHKSFQMGWKYSGPGDVVNPYTLMGWSRGFNSTGSGNPNESYVLQAQMEPEEAATGQFSFDMAVLGAGLQLNQLHGELSGVTFFAEAMVLVRIPSGKVLPAAGIGATFLF